MKIPQELREMGKLILTEDNRATAHPIFVVRQYRRIHGMDPNYGEDNYEWVHTQDHEFSLPSDGALEEYLDSEDGDITEFEKVYYLDIEVNVQPFFTEKAAQRYINSNKHNLTKPYIYVECAYRNYEWQLIREFLMGLEKQDG